MPSARTLPSTPSGRTPYASDARWVARLARHVRVDAVGANPGAAVSVPRRLGSTECAAVAALYVPALAAELPKKTAADVFARLRWGIQEKGNANTRRGNRVEPIGLEYYRKHVGPTWRAVPDGEFWTVQHPNHEWFTASPDAFDAPRPRVVVEVKSWNERGRSQWGLPGTSQMATRFLYQALWLLSCSEADECHVLCMFGNDIKQDDGELEFVITEPAIYPVERDETVERFLLDCGDRFINEFVLPGIPPPVEPGTHIRRAMKEKLTHERGADAVFEWQARCIAHAAQLGAKAVGGDGAGIASAEERP